MGAEGPGLIQEAACVVPRVLGHDLHQLAQEQGDLHVHQRRTQCQLRLGRRTLQGSRPSPAPTLALPLLLLSMLWLLLWLFES